MKLGKKATSIGMVFIFMVAAITFAVIMIFGYKTIAEFMGKGEQVEFYKFKVDLESNIKKIYTEYRSVDIEEFRLPSRYERICFVNLDMPPPDDCSFDLVACDAWETDWSWEQSKGWNKGDGNVFLKPLPSEGSPMIEVYKIDLGPESYLCLPIINGKFSLRLEGMGDKTRVSKG